MYLRRLSTALEHSKQCWRFLAALRELLAPAGILMIEVPDCLGNLTKKDYTMVWEEHSYYFGRETLLAAFHSAGFDLLDLDMHRYPFENVLLLYACKARAGVNVSLNKPAVAAEHVKLAPAFGDAFSACTRDYV